MRRTATGLLVISAAATVAVGAWVYRERAGTPGSIPVLELRPRRFTRVVTAEGTLKAKEATALTTPLEVSEAVKIAWLAADGSLVRKGDVLVRFDPTGFANRLREGKEEDAIADNRVRKADSQAAASRANSQRDAEQANRELEAARTFQKKDAEIFSRSQLIESEIDERLAFEKLEHAHTVRQTRDRLSRAERDLLSIEQRKAQLKIRRAQRGLGALEVRAPHDGILVLKRDWRGEIPRVGDTSWSGEPLGEIPDLSSMQAEVFVLEADAGGLAVGQKATVNLESRPGVAYPARLSRVEPIAKPRRRNVPVQYFGAALEFLQKASTDMKPGGRVRALLTVEDRPRALAVPLHSVFEKEGKRIVYRVARGRFEPVTVSLGPSSLGMIVIEKGLSPGDRVALSDPTKPEPKKEGGKTRLHWPASGVSPP